MGVILTFVGILLLLLTLAAVAFGLFMATDPKTREQGRLFAIWWVPGVAAAGGVLMRDVVTFAVGLLCFLVAGAFLTFADKRPGGSKEKRGKPEGGEDSVRTTKENETGGGYGKAAS